jgi:signal transduction histidine kinase
VTSYRHLQVPGRAGLPFGGPVPGLRVVLGAVAAIVAVSALLAIRDTTTWRTTYASAAPEAAMADLVAGIGLIASGVYVGADRAGRRLGVLLLLAGSAWLSADVVGWQGQSMQVRILATAGAALTLPLLLHVVAVAPGGHTASRRLAVVVGLAYVLIAAVGLALVITRDPLAEASCWNLCSTNPFLLVERPDLASVLARTADLLAVLGGILVVLVAGGRLVSASPLARRTLALVLVPGLLVGSLVATSAAARAWFGASGPSEPAAMILFQLSAWAIAALAAGIWLVVRRSRRTRAAIHALAAARDDGGARGSATDVLVRATRDRSLRIAYRLPGSGHFVDANGKPTSLPEPVASRALTSVTRGGDEVAVIDHDPERITAAELIDLLGPAARLTLENERLDAQVLAQLRELRESRTRIVAAGDRERRRRERDLHDGAQQRLLALTYDLRSARSVAGDSAEPSITEHLDAAIEAVHAAHDELRELAHGIYPAVLTEAGLARALDSLVDRAPIPTRLEAEGLARCGADAEMTAYVIADELLRDAARRGAGRSRLQVSTRDDLLVLEAHDDGRAPDGAIVHGQDRAGAAGGRLTLEQRVEGDVTTRLEMPCASS